LDKLSWKCGKGDHIAFCGKTGCGKSTSIALIQRFFEMSAGEILIDSKPIQYYDVNFLRSQIGSVGQEPVLFAKSIRDNLLYGCEESVGEEVLIDACVKANAWEFISKLPQQLDTLVGPAGMQLSGGQKQRVAIARAVLHDPKILLLDEATSALDNKSEGVVQEALDELMKGRTSFTVAHRLVSVSKPHSLTLTCLQGSVQGG
jgi:ATP-binding cassette subfamily B (MDR/TAP) protein 1